MSKQQMTESQNINNHEVKNANGDIINFKSLEAGKYSIHVYIQEARGLINPTDKTGTIDPVVKVEAFEQKKTSKIQEDRGSGRIYFGQHIFIEKNLIDGSELESARITISMFDHNSLIKDSLIGCFDVDAVSVYFNQKNSIFHQWVALSNVKKNAQAITGFLKYSINITGPKDQQQILQDEKLKENDIVMSKEQGTDAKQIDQIFTKNNILLPPQIKTQTKQLNIYLDRGQKFVEMDIGYNETIDPYFIFQLGGVGIKSSIIDNNINPVWQEKLQIPYSEPTVNNTLTAKLMDYDTAIDELAGTFQFHLSDIPKYFNSNQKFQWFHIYGSQRSKYNDNKDNAKIMNNNPQLGTFWRGRVRIGFDIEDCENPKLQKQEYQIPLNQVYDNKKHNAVFGIQLDLLYGMLFPDEKESYFIQMRWGEYEKNFPKVPSDKGVWKYFSSQYLVVNFPYVNDDSLPDIFIYLIREEKKYAYIRIKVDDFKKQVERQKYRLIRLNPDLACKPNLKEDKAGLLKIRYAKFKQFSSEQEANQEMSKVPDLNKEQPWATTTVPNYLMVNLYQGQDLLPGDDNGSCDPFVRINFFGNSIEFPYIKNTLNPIWNLQKVMTVKEIPIEHMPPLVIQCYDYDGPNDFEYIGGNVIDIQDALNPPVYSDGPDKGKQRYLPYCGHFIKLNTMQIYTDPVKPCWIPIRYGKQNDNGRLLLSLKFVKNRDSSMTDHQQKQKPIEQISFPLSIKRERYNITLRILGLRGLKSRGLIPVKRPFIKFDLNSLRYNEEKQILQEKQYIQTEPIYPGSNPNICKIIQFSLDLPVDVEFMPNLSCIVHDNVMMGLSQPILGTFSIDLKRFVQAYLKKYNQKFKALGKLFLDDVHLNFLGQQLKQQYQEEQQIQQQDQKNNQTSNSNVIVDKSQINLSEGEENIKKNLISEEDINEMKYQKFEPYNLLEVSSYQQLQDGSEEQQQKEPNQNVEQNPDQNTLEINVVKQYKVIMSPEEINQQDILIKAEYEYFNQKTKIVNEPNMNDEDPSKEYWLPLGYDPVEIRSDKSQVDQIKRHYRFVWPRPLEDKSPFLDESTFDEFNIMRGKRIDTDSIFQKIFGDEEKSRSVGKFKGWVEIYSQQWKENQLQSNVKNAKKRDKQTLATRFIPGLFKGRMSVSESQKFKKQDSSLLKDKTQILKQPNQKQLDKEFLESTNIVIRLYVIDGNSLAEKDFNSSSDPYLKIKLGKQVIDCRKEYQLDKVNCDFYRYFELKSKLPGESELIIQVWDYDDFVPDDFIGETKIDLENRFFSKKWRNILNPPIETRQLYDPLSNGSTGILRCWVEVFPAELAKERKVYDIKPKPSQEFEVRIVVWDCQDVPSMDDEDCTDIYVTANIGDKKQSTDVHYRAMGGEGSFNWRMVFPITLPSNDNSVTFQIWDKDIFTPDDFISEATLDFTDEAKEAFDNDCLVKKYGDDQSDFLQKLTSNYEKEKEREKFSIRCMNVQKEGYAKFKEQGQLKLSFSIIPKSQAMLNKVGQGREEPNRSPWLPAPVGRFEWTFNPIKLFCRLVGPKARLKVCIALCVTLLISLLVAVLPSVIGSSLSKALS